MQARKPTYPFTFISLSFIFLVYSSNMKFISFSFLLFLYLMNFVPLYAFLSHSSFLPLSFLSYPPSIRSHPWEVRDVRCTVWYSFAELLFSSLIAYFLSLLLPPSSPSPSIYPSNPFFSIRNRTPCRGLTSTGQWRST